jgi:hypothetical protein
MEFNSGLKGLITKRVLSLRSAILVRSTMKGTFKKICSLISGVGTNVTDYKHVTATRK